MDIVLVISNLTKGKTEGESMSSEFCVLYEIVQKSSYTEVTVKYQNKRNISPGVSYGTTFLFELMDARIHHKSIMT